MDLTFETQDKENSKVLLKIIVKKDEIKKEYDEKLLDAQKNAQIAGFRKGKVPVSVLETKYKEGFLADTANSIIEKAYKEILEKVEKKPIAYSTPTLENFNLPELDKDYSFELIYDVFPEYSFDEYKNIEVEKIEVKVTDDDINKDLDRSMREFVTIEPKEGNINKDDIVTIDYMVFHEDKEQVKKENEYIYVGKDYDQYKLGNDLIGMKKGDEKEFEKTYPDTEIEKLTGKTFKIKIKINEVKQEKKPELNDELAKQINEECDTVKDLKNKIKSDLEKFSETTIKQIAINKAITKLSATFKGDIPESMIEQQQNIFYNDFVGRFGGDEKKALSILKMENLTKDSYFEKIKEDAVNEIKRGLILQKIVKDENIKANDDDISKYIEPIAARYKMSNEDFLKMYKDAGRLGMIENEIEATKALDLIYDNIKFKKSKKVTLEELFQPDKL